MTLTNSSFLPRCAFLVLALGLAFAAACGDDGHSDVGTVTLALVQVPSDVACISVTVTGNRTVTRLSDVMPGQASTLTFGGLPVGSDTFTGSAYSTSCAMVTGSSVPTWTGGPVTATVSATTSTPVTLTLQRNGRASVSIDFNDGTACDATSCATGCCAGGMCVARSLTACAPPGAACAACDPTAADNCNPMGFCACGPNPSCPPGSTCQAGLCVAVGCNPMNCPNGCCAGSTCVPGFSETACGIGGVACVSCPPGTVCSVQHCM